MSVQSDTLSVAISPVALTESAAGEFKRLMEEGKLPADQGLRIGVKGGGCAGFSYVLGFDKKQEGDEEYFSQGIKIFMEKSHEIHLHGTELDFIIGLNNRGFVFKNPNAASTCGCGNSFS